MDHYFTIAALICDRFVIVNMTRFLILCFALMGTAYSQTYLNGISPYEQLSKEYYIGALYLPEAESDRMAIIEDRRAQKMVIKVTAGRWSQRKFAQFWRQDLALNNELSQDAGLTSQLMAFTKFPEESLTEGDEIIIKYTPVNGSEVFLNGELVFQVSDSSFFKSILKSWIGEVPHSRLFQSHILGQQTEIGSRRSVLQERMNQLTVAEDRQSLVSGWRAAEEAAREALAQAQAEEEARKRAEEEARRQAKLEKERLEKERQRAQQLAEQRRQEAEKAKEAKEENPEAVQQALEAQREAERKAAELARAQAAKEREQAAAALRSEAQQYALDLYRWEVLRDVYKRVSYPEWARQFNQEGVVTIEFVVNSQGNLVGVTSLQPADSGLLGQELKEAVNRAAPFKPFPVQINDKQMRVVVDYEFTLEDRVAEVPAAPEPPAGLDTDGELTGVQKAVGWAKYKDEVIADLSSAIEYPFWAQDLKQEGDVSAEVTIRADGSISGVKIVRRSRHNILNQEVEQAMDRVGSVSAFPSWVQDETLTVLIEHSFKL